MRSRADQVHMPRKSSEPIEPRLITKAQAAEYCGLSPAGYDAWFKAGRLPGPIPGTTDLIARPSTLRWIA